MKLAISNIAWPHGVRAGTRDEEPLLKLLGQLGVTGIEIAPTKIWPSWDDSSAPKAKDYAQKLRDFGLTVPALQSLLFNKPDLTLFGTPSDFERMLAHIKKTAELAEAFGAPTLVFGAPKNRRLPEDGDHDRLQELGVNRLRQIGAVCGDYGINFCLEPNPKEYACNFMTNAPLALEIVNRVRHDRVCLHLDTGCMTLAGDRPESIAPAIAQIQHFHVSEPYLKSFSKPLCRHDEFAAALRQSGYNRWISIEMLSEQLVDIALAVSYAAEQYKAV